MQCIVLFFLIVTRCGADQSGFYRLKDKPAVRRAHGIEFDSISRSTLLQVLAAFEENIKNRLGTNAKPYFVAEFANNKYTRPFIYPKMKRI
ncbi:unnamed protein product, partial [Brenthis ino]